MYVLYLRFDVMGDIWRSWNDSINDMYRVIVTDHLLDTSVQDDHLHAASTRLVVSQVGCAHEIFDGLDLPELEASELCSCREWLIVA